jgi:hypothetical protein
MAQQTIALVKAGKVHLFEEVKHSNYTTLYGFSIAYSED